MSDRCWVAFSAGGRQDDAETIRCGLRARHILPLLAERRTEHGSGRLMGIP
jgi:hypothetical protein